MVNKTKIRSAGNRKPQKAIDSHCWHNPNPIKPFIVKKQLERERAGRYGFGFSELVSEFNEDARRSLDDFMSRKGFGKRMSDDW